MTSRSEKGGGAFHGIKLLLCDPPLPPIPEHPNLLVTRTLSKAHSLAGFRVGYAVLPEAIADDLNAHNDAYPLARPSEAAAIATALPKDNARFVAALRSLLAR